MRCHQLVIDFVVCSWRTRCFEELSPNGLQFRFVFLENEMFCEVTVAIRNFWSREFGENLTM